METDGGAGALNTGEGGDAGAAGGGGGAGYRRGSRGGDRRGRRATRLDDTQRVVAGDATARTGSRHFGLADPVLRKQPAHHGRQKQGIPATVARHGGHRCGRRRRRGGRRRCCGLLRWWRWRWRWRWRWGRRRRWCSGRRLRRRCRGRPAVSVRPGTVADHRQPHADLDRLALGHEDLGEDAGRRRGHLGVDLVRRYFEQRLVAFDCIADPLHPAGDRALGHGLAELRHHHVSQRAVPFR